MYLRISKSISFSSFKEPKTTPSILISLQKLIVSSIFFKSFSSYLNELECGLNIHLIGISMVLERVKSSSILGVKPS